MLEGKELLLFLDIKSHRNADDGIIFADSSFCMSFVFSVKGLQLVDIFL